MTRLPVARRLPGFPTRKRNARPRPRLTEADRAAAIIRSAPAGSFDPAQRRAAVNLYALRALAEIPAGTPILPALARELERAAR